MKLKEYRRLNKLTLEDVSIITGISISAISKIENNQMAISDDTVSKLRKLTKQYTFTNDLEQPSSVAKRYKSKIEDLEDELNAKNKYIKELQNEIYKLNDVIHKAALVLTKRKGN